MSAAVPDIMTQEDEAIVGGTEARNGEVVHMGSRNRSALYVQDMLPQAMVGCYRPQRCTGSESRSRRGVRKEIEFTIILHIRASIGASVTVDSG